MKNNPLEVVREGNAWVVYRNVDGQDEPDYLTEFDCSRLGDQVAREMANVYKTAFEIGYHQSLVDGEAEQIGV